MSPRWYLNLVLTPSIEEDMTISAGTFDLNGRTLNFGDGASDVLSITGTLEVDANSTLAMGASTSLVVNSGGTISVLGTDAGNVATVSRQSTGTYSFNVNGTITARYYLFEYMNTSFQERWRKY